MLSANLKNRKTLSKDEGFSNLSPKEAAKMLIQNYNLTPPINLRKLSKLLKIDVHFRELPDNCDGWVGSLKPEFIGTVKHLIVVNSNRSIVRQRFTIAHEIGHIVLKHYENFDKKELLILCKNLAEGSKEETLNYERGANIFASELLIPSSHLLKLLKQKNNVSTEELSAFYRVSKQAMEIKLAEIKNLL